MAIIVDDAMRINEKPVKLDAMFAHQADCHFCDTGIVKMSRNRETLELEPHNCWCLLCGQRYYMDIEDLKEFDDRQGHQKTLKRNWGY